MPRRCLKALGEGSRNVDDRWMSSVRLYWRKFWNSENRQEFIPSSTVNHTNRAERCKIAFLIQRRKQAYVSARSRRHDTVCVSLFVIDTGSTGSRGPILTWGLPVYPPPLLRRWLCRSTPNLIGCPSQHRGRPGSVSRSKTP